MLTFHRGGDPSSGLRGIFNVPNTGGLDPTNYCLVQLTDAIGTLNVLRCTGASENFVLDPVDPNNAAPNALIFAPASGVPANLPPLLATASPAPNAVRISPLSSLDLAIVNGDSPVVLGSIHLKLAGNDVTSSSSISSTTDGAAVHYQPQCEQPIFVLDPSDARHSRGLCDATRLGDQSRL